jgi:hypothetical protein
MHLSLEAPAVDHIDIQVQGKTVTVPSSWIDARRVITTGKCLKIAAVMDEELVEGDTVPSPVEFVSQLKKSKLGADIFTFAQKVPDSIPKYEYHLEWENAAVVPITSYSAWWEKRVEYDVRKAVKRASRMGVVVKTAEFDEKLVEGICQIYNESAVRQGKAFWHYQKTFDAVKRENATYLDRSTFIGAYYNDELIGFIKMVYVGTVATTLQVISQKRHFEKKPMSALLAKAVELCEQKGVSHLVYGRYIYNDPKSSLTEFKRRNGFEMMMLPRYYIPLNAIGRIGLRLNLHRQMTDRIPKPIAARLRKARAVWHNLKARSDGGAS